MRKYCTKISACVLAAAMIMNTCQLQSTGAAKAPKLDKTNVSVKAGKKTVIKVKNGKKSAKVTWKTSKSSVAKITAKKTAGNKAQATVKAVKSGKATITASYKYKGAVKKLKCNVKVSGADDKSQTTKAPTIAPTKEPTTAPTQAPTKAPTTAPTKEPTPSPTPTPKLVTAADTELVDHPDNFKTANADTDYGTFETITYHSTLIDADRKANVVLPPDYDTDKEYPVVYMMHGIGCDKSMFGSNIGSCSIAKILGNLYTEEKAKEMIVVFPAVRVSNEPESNMHSNENYKLYDDFREDLIECLMPAMEEEYSVATGRENAGVCGWSMGGREALYIGLSRPDMFGFVAGYCPAFGLLPYSNPDVGRGEDGLLAARDEQGNLLTTEDGEVYITLPDEYINNTYVQISAGKYDTVVHDEPVKYCNAIKAGNIPYLYNEYPSGHSEGVWEPGFYNFALNAFKTVE